MDYAHYRTVNVPSWADDEVVCMCENCSKKYWESSYWEDVSKYEDPQCEICGE
jgi:uncharacterized protein with PIN domain